MEEPEPSTALPVESLGSFCKACLDSLDKRAHLLGIVGTLWEL